MLKIFHIFSYFSSLFLFFFVLLSPVDEEALKKKITDELHKNLKQQRVKAEQDMQAWLAACTQTPYTHFLSLKLKVRCF